MTIKTIGVIGAGQMGGGIAHVLAFAGYAVRVQDVSETQLAALKAGIGANMDRQIKKGAFGEAEKDAALARISTHPALDALADCQLVIEAATEREALKIEIFKALVQHLAPEAIVASNTSSISITRLAAASERPERFVGLHFMNPVPLMQLVELIPGIATSPETLDAMKTIVARIEKTAVVSNDAPGFIVNRILMPMINEAVFALSEGVATAEAIDTAMMLGANQPIGPLQLADLIGLDTCLAIMRVLHTEFGDSKYRPCPMLVRYVDAGWLGRKTGRGFYRYEGGKIVA